MKNNIKSIEIDDAGKAYAVNYYSGTTRWFTRSTLPYTALYFFRTRINNPKKVFVKRYPKFAGKNSLHIIGELTYYLIID